MEIEIIKEEEIKSECDGVESEAEEKIETKKPNKKEIKSKKEPKEELKEVKTEVKTSLFSALKKLLVHQSARLIIVQTKKNIIQ